MSYDDYYARMQWELLQLNGEFSMEKVFVIAFRNSPDHFTKKDIKEHALKVLDAVLNDGMVRMKEDGIYESVFSKPKRRWLKLIGRNFVGGETMPSNQIDLEVKFIVEKFLKESIYPNILDKDNLLGVLVYGSSLTGFSSKNSDIDLLIILNEAEETIRGVQFFEGKKIEYFIKPIEKFLSESISFTKRNCPSHVALEQNAYILYDKGDFIKNILLADKQFYNANREKIKQNYDLKFVQIDNRLASLKNILDRDGEEFYMVYYNILEMIRTFHSQRNDEAEIPFAKAYRIYTDDSYYEKFVSKNATNNLPDPTFVNLYVKCISLNDKKEMLDNLIDLYKYEKKHVEINPNNYKIKLK